jgi:hypothetical protein
VIFWFFKINIRFANQDYLYLDMYSYLLEQAGQKWLYMAAFATLMVIILAVVSGPIIASFLEDNLIANYVALDDLFEITHEFQAQNPPFLTRVSLNPALARWLYMRYSPT